LATVTILDNADVMSLILTNFCEYNSKIPKEIYILGETSK